MRATTGYAPAAGAEIYFERFGKGKPVVFAHAGVIDRTMWEPQVQTFAQSHTVVVFDARGYGRSRSDAGSYQLADDVFAVIDHLELSTATLVGSSRGGAACLDAAVRTPDRVDGLVWVCGGVSGLAVEPAAEDAAVFKRLEEMWDQGDWAGISALEAKVWVDGISSPEGRAGDELREWVRNMTYAIHTADASGLVVAEPDLPAAENLDRIRAPLLIVVGELDTSATLQSAEYLARGVGHSQTVSFPDSAHLPSLEHPTRFDEALSSFLVRHGL